MGGIWGRFGRWGLAWGAEGFQPKLIAFLMHNEFGDKFTRRGKLTRLLFLEGGQLRGEMVLLPRRKYVALIRDALIGGDIPQRLEEFERAALRIIQSVDRDARKLFVSLWLNGDAYFALMQVGGGAIVYGETIAYRRTAGEQEGECEGEDPFHFVPALSAALCDIFNFVNTIELCHFEVSNKGPAGNILQVSALLNRHKI